MEVAVIVGVVATIGFIYMEICRRHDAKLKQ